MTSTENQNNEHNSGFPVSGDCDNCILLMTEECDASFHIPPCMYEEAGIDSDNGIVFSVGDGEIIITEIDDDDGDGDGD